MKALELTMKNGKNLRIEAEYKKVLFERVIDADGWQIKTGDYNVIDKSYIRAYLDGEIYDSKHNDSGAFELWDAREYQSLFQAGSKEVFPEGSKKIRGLRIVFAKPEAIEKYEQFIAEVKAEGYNPEVAEYEEKKEAEEKEKELKELDAIITEAEKEMQYGELLTREEVKAWKRNWNNINNEGGYGFVPDKISKEQYEHALKRKAELEKGD